MLRVCSRYEGAGSSAMRVAAWAARGVFTSSAPLTPAAAAPDHMSIPSVWCVGRNYAEHIKELGNSQDLTGPGAKKPMIFLKSGSSVAWSGALELPSWSSDVHHEVELAVQLGPNLEPVAAAVALDLTARDVQARLKQSQHPWTLAKAFKNSTPLGSFFSLGAAGTGASAPPDLQDVQLVLTVNGAVRQHGHTRDMIHDIRSLLTHVREHFPVAPGDIVLTGTPHGVSRLADGDRIEAKVVSNGGKVLSEGSWTAVQKSNS
ncbi:hypothetical protein FOA52_016312 [Chlamydomonas sp. UWO 241]|nr:hypothetical protein FOA52_016312 [Chlamydomonas sp. UWO 241]